MMKSRKTVAALILLLAAVAMAAAATPQSQPRVTSDVHAEAGDFSLLAGVDLGLWGIGITGGAELILQKFNIPGFPLSLGAMGLASVRFSTDLHLEAAGMATLHWGLKPYLDLPEFFRNFDWYAGLGLGISILPHFGIGLASGGGVSYYVSDKFAIELRSFYVTTGHYSSSIGVRLEM